MAALVPCPACNRHVLATERACPFCSSALPTLAPRASAGRALTRAAILFAGASAISACSSEPEPVVMYGPAPIDASADVKDGNNVPDVVAMYGPVPVDAGQDATDADTNDAPNDSGDAG